MPMPTKRFDDVEQEILRRISEGEPLAVICRSDPKRMPTPMTWGNWCNADENLAIAYARLGLMLLPLNAYPLLMMDRRTQRRSARMSARLLMPNG